MEPIVITEEERKRVRSELARESVNKRWARLGPEERRLAVAPANEARRLMGRRKRGRKGKLELRRLLAMLN